MNEEFVSFDLAKKLKEKGFNCEYPFAMYNKYEQFCPLYSSDKDCFGIDDFDKHACIAPTISQVLKWLRKDKKINIFPHYLPNSEKWMCFIYDVENIRMHTVVNEVIYEEAVLAGIEYVIDNLI